MKEKKIKIPLVVLSLFLPLLFWMTLHAGPLKVAENLCGETVLLSLSTPVDSDLGWCDRIVEFDGQAVLIHREVMWN